LTDLEQTVAELEQRLIVSAAEREELLLQQAASAEILKVINNSRGNLAAVFDTILEKATLLCGAGFSALAIHKGGDMHEVVAHRGAPPALVELVQAPVRLGPETGLGRLVRGESFVHILDAADDEGYRLGNPVRVALVDVAGARTYLVVPIRKDDVMLGSFTVYRREVRPFSPESIALLQSFATQAAIAMENARLFNETQEALEQQTATADVLKVISRSAFDLDSVMNTLAQSAAELCKSDFSALYLRRGELLVAQGLAHTDPAQADFVRRTPLRTDSSTYVGRTLLSGSVRNIGDYRDETEAGLLRKFAEMLGFTSILYVPLMRDTGAIGVFALARKRPGQFSQREVELVQTFADQAVIAIENARLFDEVQGKTRDLEEALEHQTATAEVLQVISGSMADPKPVFERIVDSIERLIDHKQIAIFRAPGDGLVHMVARRGVNIEGLDALYPQPADQSTVPIVIGAGRQVYYADALNGSDVPPSLRKAALKAGNFCDVLTPMMWEDRGVGMIAVTREPNAGFSDKELKLLQTFADQAVIAIENARLFNEVQARTHDLEEALRYQTGSANILNVIACSPTDVQPVLQAIVESACEFCGASDAIVTLKDKGEIQVCAHYGPIPQNQMRWPDDRTSTTGRAMADRRPVHVHDVLSEEGAEFPVARRLSLVDGCRTLLSAPLLREDEAIGAIALRRAEVHPFTDKQIDLLQTFANQAVIAIANARLFNETQEALELQKASAEILSVISNSVADTQPVFDKILHSIERLFGGESRFIFLVGDDGLLHIGAVHGPNAERSRLLFPVPIKGTASEVAIRERRLVAYADVMNDPDVPAFLRESAHRLGENYSTAVAPMLWKDSAIGSILVGRTPPNPFTDKELATLQTFADQAVIAIQNARMFKELQARTRELAASLEDLRTAQDRLVQTEKLASLGQLTAGIAHEIKNPLNFVNKFAALSAELTDELDETLVPAPLDQKMRGEVGELTQMLKSNLEKVVQHGKRADSIVKNMLLHSREGSGERRASDLNALVSESLNLAYHGARAERSDFNISLEQDLDPDAGAVEVYPQELTRALLNVISNGFYAAVRRKMESGGKPFEPVLSAVTKNAGSAVEIRIRDNGTGIPAEIREKIFNPFFTTKPTGEGTGLGLSMTHDIVVKQHGGRIDVETRPGSFTEFIITLPRNNGTTSSSRESE
jgi:GAF domain-containing protein